MSKIKKPSELSVTPLMKALIYGQPGIGKSTLALSMPEPLMIDCDRGIHRVDVTDLSDTVEVDSWTDVDEVLNDKEELKKFSTLIFDTAGSLIDFMSAHIIKTQPKMAMSGGQLSLQGYGVRKVMFQSLLSRIHTLGLHVVFVSHEREERDGDLRFVRPEVGGSSGADLIKGLDIVGYMESIGNKRVVRFNPQEKFYAKNSLSLPDPMSVPDKTKHGNKFMAEILEMYHKQLSDRQLLAPEYEDLLGVIKSNAEDIVDAETANKFIEWMKTVTHIWDSRYQAGKILRDREGELSLRYDKQKGKYVEPAKTKA